MKHFVNFFLLAGAITFVSPAPILAGGSTVVPLDPRAAYIHVCNDPAENAPALSLAGLGLSPGETILIELLGEWDCGAPCGDDAIATGAVFSGSATLLDGSQSHRVPDAIAAGTPSGTGLTHYCGTPTDIPEDFRVDPSVMVVIPPGATHLFIGALDSLFYDNTDPDEDYAVRITYVSVGVESTTWGKLKSLYR